MPIQEGSVPRQYPWRRERSAHRESLALPSLGVLRLRLLNKACIPLWECYASTTKYSNMIKIEIVTRSLHHPPALRCLSLSIPFSVGVLVDVDCVEVFDVKVPYVKVGQGAVTAELGVVLVIGDVVVAVSKVVEVVSSSIDVAVVGVGWESTFCNVLQFC